MAIKATIWLCLLMFIAMIFNVISAYNAIGSVDVQGKFQTIGLLNSGKL